MVGVVTRSPFWLVAFADDSEVDDKFDFVKIGFFGTISAWSLDRTPNLLYGFFSWAPADLTEWPKEEPLEPLPLERFDEERFESFTVYEGG